MNASTFSQLGSFFLFIGSIFSSGTPLFSPKSISGKDIFTVWKTHSCNSELHSSFVELEHNMEEIFIDTEKQECFQKDFAQLFITPNRNILLWESQYLSSNNELYTETLYDVQTIYASAGFTFIHTGKECDDHIAVELAFLGRLLVESIDNEAYTRLADNFVNSHLALWAIPCLENLLQHAKTAIWNALLSGTKITLQHIMEANHHTTDIKEYI